jgi:tripartite ATP-independent transporter DctM subunit
MSVELVTVLLFGGMVLLLSLGVPVVFALGGISVSFIFLLWGERGLYTVATTTIGTITNPILITIPLFLLMGNFLFRSGISDHLFQALSYWLSSLKGSLAIVTIGTCVALATITGFGPGILTMGLIAVPAMLKHAYDKSLALGVVMAGGVLGDIIPPSIMMIIFAFIARLSVGRLFFGGVIPGLICAGLYILYVVIRCRLQPQLAPKVAENVTWQMRWASLKGIIIPALLVVMVLGSIFLGIATPTEAAGVGAFGAFLCCLIYRRFSWKMLTTSCLETLKISGMVLWILVAATLFSITTRMAGIHTLVVETVGGLPVHPWVILLGMQVILMVLGMFMDDYAIIGICAPIFMPVAVALDFNPYWFAMVFILNMQVAYLTPPFGWALILMRGVAPPEVTTAHIWRAVPPFVAVQLLVLVLTMLFPQLALWLPGKMF